MAAKSGLGRLDALSQNLHRVKGREPGQTVNLRATGKPWCDQAGPGFGLCRFFKQDRDVPLVAVSVLECRDRALEAGADAFLRKPLDPLQFVSTVSDLLGSSAFLLSPEQEASHG